MLARHTIVGFFVALLPGLASAEPPEDDTPEPTAVPTPLPSSIAGRCEALLPMMERVATAQGVDVGLMVAVARIESGFDPRAESRAGALGLMQVMPGTGRTFACGDLKDAEQNAQCGAKVLRKYFERYKNNAAFGLSAYHMGPLHADRAQTDARLPQNLSYVENVLRVRSRFLRAGGSCRVMAQPVGPQRAP